jgi:flavodoxin
MNTLVIYFSKFGNTQRLAEAIAKRFDNTGNVRTISSDDLTVNDLTDADLVVMGSPTHNMNLPKSVKPVFEQLPKRILRGTPVAAFDTSYKMSWILNHFTASKRLAKKLRRLGGRLLLPPEIFHVTEREGPLFEGEIERAQAWAGLMLEKATGQT